MFPDTARAIKDNTAYEPFIRQALTNTDLRIQTKQHVTPAFLLGALLWPAVEILRVTRTVRECIRTKGRLGDVPDLIKKGRDLYSMQLFDQHLLELVSHGLISMEVAVYASSNPEEFERSLRIE